MARRGRARSVFRRFCPTCSRMAARGDGTEAGTAGRSPARPTRRSTPWYDTLISRHRCTRESMLFICDASDRCGLPRCFVGLAARSRQEVLRRRHATEKEPRGARGHRRRRRYQVLADEEAENIAERRFAHFRFW